MGSTKVSEGYLRLAWQNSASKLKGCQGCQALGQRPRCRTLPQRFRRGTAWTRRVERILPLKFTSNPVITLHTITHSSTHTQSHIQTVTYTQSRTHNHTVRLAHEWTSARVYEHTSKHAHTRARTHAHTHARTHARTHTHTHRHSYTRTHTHTHTRQCSSRRKSIVLQL